MTNISNAVLDTYQVRKTKKQKTKFIEYATDFATQRGYVCTVEKGALGARNIVVGSPDTAEVIYTAHYDTCPVLPFPNFITPKKIGWYLLYQLLLVLGIFALYGVVDFVVGFVTGLVGELMAPDAGAESILFGVSFAISYAAFIGILLLLLVGPANKHTANDNTSGVVTLLTIMDTLPEASRHKVAFVFFDLEETGLFGSAGFASKHKKSTANTLLINFDCVSDGKHILLAVKKTAACYIPLLENSFISNDEFNVEIVSKGVFYPSDQANFKGGVGVASLKYSKVFKTLYMDRIHTKRDVIFEEENILYLSACAVSLAEQMAEI